MNILNIEVITGNNLLISINWIVLLILVLIIVVIILIIKKGIFKFRKKSIAINEVVLGIGSNTVALDFDQKDRAVAYKIWVELSTRKIGIPFDKENDVIVEIYDSWYEFFTITRELLKEIPSNRINGAMELIELSEKVLNEGLRPHLTKWQAKYRRWYNDALNNDKEKTPQEIQKEFEEYDILIEDIVKTNNQMIEYKNLMHNIAFM